MDNVLISMTSIPGRARFLAQTLKSLVTQTAGIPQIAIYLPEQYHRFSAQEVAEHRSTIEGITTPFKNISIHSVSRDLGPLTKMAYAVTDPKVKSEFQRVVFVDDDLIYSPQLLANFDGHPTNSCLSQSGNWLTTFSKHSTNSHLAYGRALKSRGWKYRLLRLKQKFFSRTAQKPSPHSSSGYTQLIEGWSGVSVDPNWFDEEILDIPANLFNADDVWISGYLEFKKIGIYVPSGCALPTDNGTSDVDALKSITDIKNSPSIVYRSAIEHCQQRWNIWR